MYILDYLRKHFLQYKYSVKFGISKGFFLFFFIKEVFYAHQGCSLSIWLKKLNIISQNNIVKYYCNLK